jgi:protein-S-isoprenylcysteine O-methyltransferase Ste14
MVSTHRCWSDGPDKPVRRLIFQSPLMVAGLGISAWHKRLFHRVGTNIDTFGEPGQFVTDGMFRVTRNPMYLGFVLALLGLSVILGSLTPLVFALSFIVITDRWYIALEEKAMAQKLGEQYTAYKKRVRRWI